MKVAGLASERNKAVRYGFDDDAIEAIIDERIVERVFSSVPLPCPFCGSERVYVDESVGCAPAVFCRDCLATCGKNVQTREQAVRAWNMRNGVGV